MGVDKIDVNINPSDIFKTSLSVARTSGHGMITLPKEFIMKYGLKSKDRVMLIYMGKA